MTSHAANLARRFALAMTHHQAGNLPEAERIYKAILRNVPCHSMRSITWVCSTRSAAICRKR